MKLPDQQFPKTVGRLTALWGLANSPFDPEIRLRSRASLREIISVARAVLRTNQTLGLLEAAGIPAPAVMAALPGRPELN